jgi:hypothetical protein
MKYLRLFEEISVTGTNLHEGDYVIIDTHNTPYLDKDCRDFINNNIGQIFKIVPYTKDAFYIKYENIPERIKQKSFIKGGEYENSICFHIFSIKIIDVSKNKKDLEYIYRTKKYNI